MFIELKLERLAFPAIYYLHIIRHIFMAEFRASIKRLFWYLFYLALICTISIIIFSIYNNRVITSNISYLTNAEDNLQIKFYSEIRENNIFFNSQLQQLENDNIDKVTKSQLVKLCNFQIEDGKDRIDVARAYDCLLRLRSNSAPELYKAIKNGSYGLDIIYLKTSSLNLAKLLILGHEQQILEAFGVENINALHKKYFTGLAKDEVPFLENLIKLNIPEVSARSLYRLSLINLVGRASFNDGTYKPNIKAAYQQLNEVTKIAGIEQNNIIDIAIIINDKFAKHAAVTIASALVNSDLDSFYRFHIIMNPDDPVSDDAKRKLASMNYIRDYSIDFTNFDNKLIPVELMKSKMALGDRFPLLVNYRLFLDKIFANLDFILYLDSDILVLRDLNNFKKINMQDHLAAAALDTGFISRHKAYNDKKCHRALPNFYKNSGVLYFNLRNMRELDSASMLLQQLTISDCDFLLPDQDLIGLAFQDRIYNLSIRWNMLTIFDNFYPQFSPFIIHFAGKKPWESEEERLWQEQPSMLSNNAQDYWRYREITPWPINN